MRRRIVEVLMQAALVMMTVLSLANAGLTWQQEPPPHKPPRKGDRVVVKGCLSGPMLEATEIGAAETDQRLPTAATFRLTGDKKLLKQMRSDENGKLVEITGVLKSELSHGDGRPGTQIGRTRIVVGVEGAQSMHGRPAAPPMPVVEVKSYETLVASCAG